DPMVQRASTSPIVSKMASAMAVDPPPAALGGQDRQPVARPECCCLCQIGSTEQSLRLARDRECRGTIGRLPPRTTAFIARDPPCRQQQGNVEDPRFCEQRFGQRRSEPLLRLRPFRGACGGVALEQQRTQGLARGIESKLALKLIAGREDRT